MTVRATYYLISSLNWFASVLPMAVSVLLAQSRGLSLGEIGLYGGVYTLCVAVLEVPSGAIADSFGRKRTTVVAYGLALVAKLLFLLAFDMPMFIVYALIWGLARALASGALEAWFIDSLLADDPKADLQQALARAGTVNLIGLAAGTLAGSSLPAIFAWLPADGAAILTPLSTTLVASVLVGIVVMVLAALLVHEERPPVATATGPRFGWRDGFGVLRTTMADAVDLARSNGRLRTLLAAEFAVGIVLMSSENLWQPFFAARLEGWSPAGSLEVLDAGSGGTLLLGIVLAGCFGAGVIGNLLATPLAALMRRRYALLAGLFHVFQGAAFVVLALQTNVLLATAFLWITYLTRAAWSSPHAALYNREVPAARRTVMLSVQSLAGFAGSFVGSVALGHVAEVWSITAAWSLAGACLMVTAFLYLGLDRQRGT